MAPNKNGNGAGSKAASDKNKKGTSTAAANDEWMKEQTTNTTPKEDETNTKESSSSNSTTTSSTDTQNELHDYVWVAAAIFVLYKVLATAYDIRLTSIKEYGTVIHEYDPYFNYRATEVSL
jgi:asparagine N-glycosylation enzyme membrane subunit Stt3